MALAYMQIQIFRDFSLIVELNALLAEHICCVSSFVITQAAHLLWRTRSCRCRHASTTYSFSQFLFKPKMYHVCVVIHTSRKKLINKFC